MLDLLNAELLQNLLKLAADEGLLPGYKKTSGLAYLKVDNQLILYRSGTASFAQVTVDVEQNTQLSMNQDSSIVNQRINSGGNTVINIVQGR
jgi:hypothetical protein